jgi:hypothetical protein
VKRNAITLQNLLMEAEEAHDKIKRLGIELRAGNKKLMKTIMVSLIPGKLGRKPKPDLSKPALLAINHVV